MKEIKVPQGFDWQVWINRWDRMQENYIPRRAERFEIMVRLIRRTQDHVVRILDLGCGTGSLMLEMLKMFPDAEVFGIDFDPTLSPLARKRLAEFGNRAHIILNDLRKSDWVEKIAQPVNAVVSATALHWLLPEELIKLYGHLARILCPDGIFLNADHVASESKQIQQAWQKDKEQTHSQKKDTDSWETFWTDYMKALGRGTCQVHQRVLGGWQGGVEDGMPLSWHFDKLKTAGFDCVDCFWRYDCDAIYGAIK